MPRVLSPSRRSLQNAVPARAQCDGRATVVQPWLDKLVRRVAGFEKARSHRASTCSRSTTSGFLRLETDNPELWTLLGYTDEQYVQAGRTKRQDESEEDDEVFEEALGKPDETVDDGAGRSVLPSDVTIATQSGDGEQGEGGETGGDNQAAPPTTSRPQPPPSASAPSSSTSATTWYMLADETAEYPPNPRARLNNRAALRIVPSDIHEMLHVARMSMSVENADRNRILELLDELVGELSEPLNTFYTPNDNLRRIPLTFSYSPEGELIFKADNQGATVGIRSIRIHNGDTPVRLPNHVEFARAVNRRVNTKVVPLVFDYGYAIVMENGLGMALASGDSGEQCAVSNSAPRTSRASFYRCLCFAVGGGGSCPQAQAR